MPDMTTALIHRVSIEQRREIVRKFLEEGKNPNQIKNELGLGSRSTVVREVNGLVRNDQMREYVTTLAKASIKALDKLTAKLDDPDNKLSTKELTKMYHVIDQARERQHKISAGYYISHDVLREKVIPAILASVKRHVTDPAILQAIAQDLSTLTLDD